MKKTLFIFLIAISIKIDAAILLVNQSGTGGTRLSSVTSNNWNTSSFNSLQMAIDSSQSGDEIWIKKGTYTPSKNHFATSTSPTDYKNAFMPKSGTQLLGGFLGNETSKSQRNSKINITKITADYSNNDTVSITYSTMWGQYFLNILNFSDNAYHIFIIPNKQNIIIDGLLIQGGNPIASNYDTINGSDINHTSGGGVYIVNSQNISISNCYFKSNNNSIYSETSNNINFSNNYHTFNKESAIFYASQNITVKNDSFYKNLNTSGGVGIISEGSNINILNSFFTENYLGHSVNQQGVAIKSMNGKLKISKTVFYENRTTSISCNCYGGAIYFESGDTLSIDSSFFEKSFSKEYSGAIYCVGGVYKSIKNTVFKDNYAPTYGTIYSFGPLKLNNCIFENFDQNSIVLEQYNDTIYNCSFKNTGITLKNGKLRINNITSYSKHNTTILGYTNGNDSIFVKNSIFWSTGYSSFPLYNYPSRPNYFINYSDISGTNVYTGINNINSNPLFKDTINGNGTDGIYFTEDDGLSLKSLSLAINSGNNSNIPTLDIKKQNRIFGCNVDMGAYEHAIYFAGKDTSICLGSQIKIGIDTLSNYTYQWSGSNFVGNSNKANPNISPNTIGIKTYIVTATYVPNGCVNIDTVLIDVISPPNIFAGNDSILCHGDSIKLNATTLNSYFDSIIWNINNFNNNQFIKPNNSSQYISKVFFKSCFNQDTINITVNNPPSILTQPISSIECRNSNKLLITKSNNSSDSFTWYRNNSIILSSNNDTILISNIDSSKTGVYKVGIFNKCGSILSNSVNLLLRDSININSINFTIDTLCSTSVFNKAVTATGYNLTYQWKNTGNTIIGANLSNYSKTNVSIGDTGLYSLQINDGCNFSKTVAICSLKVLNTIFPTVSINTNSLVVCDENNITINYTSNNTGSNISIKWLVNNIQVSTQFQNYNYKPKNGDKIQVNISTAERCSSPKTAISNILNIGVSKPTRDTTYKNICENEIYNFAGNDYSTEGFYTVVLKNKIGCDSIKDLILTKTVMNKTTNLSNGILSAVQNTATYQWYDCSNNSKITNETKQTFKPSKTGNYKVQIKKDNCTVESVCKLVQVLNSNIDPNENFFIYYYPNPTKSKIYFSKNNLISFYVSVFDILGKEIISLLKSPSEVDLSIYSNGIFNIKIYDRDLILISNEKILKE